jgi:hypothetical protein
MTQQQPSPLATMFSWFRRRIRASKIERVERAGIRAGTHTSIRVTNPWHAVGVSVGKPCCRAAMVQQKVRYLSQEAPPLPLAGCTQPRMCLCKYKHYSDRRTGPRRATDRDLYRNALSRHVVAAWSMRERRESRGRRVTDGN